MHSVSVLWIAFGFGFWVGDWLLSGLGWRGFGLTGLVLWIGMGLVCRGCCGYGLLTPDGLGVVFW